MFYSVRGREVPVNKPPWYIANCNVCSFYVRIFLNLLLFVTCVWWCWVVMLPWKNLLCLKSCIFRNGILPSMIAAFAGPKWARVVLCSFRFLGPFVVQTDSQWCLSLGNQDWSCSVLSRIIYTRIQIKPTIEEFVSVCLRNHKIFWRNVRDIHSIYTRCEEFI